MLSPATLLPVSPPAPFPRRTRVRPSPLVSACAAPGEKLAPERSAHNIRTRGGAYLQNMTVDIERVLAEVGADGFGAVTQSDGGVEREGGADTVECRACKRGQGRVGRGVGRTDSEQVAVLGVEEKSMLQPMTSHAVPCE